MLLVRADRQTGLLEVLDAAAGSYAVFLQAGPIALRRGWAAVDLKLHGRTVRVVNTHLEALVEAVRFAQASELLAGPAASAGPTILVGDFNSGPPAPSATYGVLTSAFDAFPFFASDHAGVVATVEVP